MKFSFIIAFLLLFGFSAIGQTDPLAGMSGKAKAKALKQEEKAAKKDVEFQALMSEAHDHFSSNNFDEALLLYQKAHEKRPINQFPKVKIEDVKLARENYVEPEVKEEQKQEHIQKVEPQKSQEERVNERYELELIKADADIDPRLDLPQERPHSAQIVEDVKQEKEFKEVKEKPEVISVAELRSSLGEEYEDGVHERTFKEGKKVITERIVVADGKGDLYRKVVQPWGAIYYFKNYKSASEYTWKQSFK